MIVRTFYCFITRFDYKCVRALTFPLKSHLYPIAFSITQPLATINASNQLPRIPHVDLIWTLAVPNRYLFKSWNRNRSLSIILQLRSTFLLTESDGILHSLLKIILFDSLISLMDLNLTCPLSGTVCHFYFIKD